VGVLGEAQVRDRVAFEAVRAALEQDEVGTAGAQVVLHLLPSRVVVLVARTGWQRQVEFRAERRADAGFLRHPGAGVEIAAVLVQIREQQVRVVLECVEHAVAVVRVDVNVGDTLHPVPAPEHFDRHAAVVENAKPGCVAA